MCLQQGDVTSYTNCSSWENQLAPFLPRWHLCSPCSTLLSASTASHLNNVSKAPGFISRAKMFHFWETLYWKSVTWKQKSFASCTVIAYVILWYGQSDLIWSFHLLKGQIFIANVLEAGKNSNSNTEYNRSSYPIKAWNCIAHKPALQLSVIHHTQHRWHCNITSFEQKINHSVTDHTSEKCFVHRIPSLPHHWGWSLQAPKTNEVLE